MDVYLFRSEPFDAAGKAEATVVTGKPVNMGEQLAHSSLLAIMGRMSAYTGKTITWEETVASNETWAPVDVNNLTRKIEVAIATMENGHCLTAFEQIESEMPPNEPCSA